jgi:hypothetical protein
MAHKSKALTTKKFLFTEGYYVITHLDPEPFIIKALPDRITAMNYVNYSKTRDGGYWAYCGNGQAGWTAAIRHVAFELDRQARAVGAREAAREVQQLDLLQPTPTTQERLDAELAKAMAHLTKQLEG